MEARQTHREGHGRPHGPRVGPQGHHGEEPARTSEEEALIREYSCTYWEIVNSSSKNFR